MSEVKRPIAKIVYDNGYLLRVYGEIAAEAYMDQLEAEVARLEAETLRLTHAYMDEVDAKDEAVELLRRWVADGSDGDLMLVEDTDAFLKEDICG